MKVARWLWMVIRLLWFGYIWKLPELPLETELQILRLKEKTKERCLCVQSPPDGLTIRPMEAKEERVIGLILTYDYQGSYEELDKIIQQEDQLFWDLRRRAETEVLYQEIHGFNEGVWSVLKTLPILPIGLPRQEKWRDALRDCGSMEDALRLATLTEQLTILGYRAAQKYYNQLQNAICKL